MFSKKDQELSLLSGSLTPIVAYKLHFFRRLPNNNEVIFSRLRRDQARLVGNGTDGCLFLHYFDILINFFKSRSAINFGSSLLEGSGLRHLA